MTVQTMFTETKKKGNYKEIIKQKIIRIVQIGKNKKL